MRGGGAHKLEPSPCLPLQLRNALSLIALERLSAGRLVVLNVSSCAHSAPKLVCMLGSIPYRDLYISVPSMGVGSSPKQQ